MSQFINDLRNVTTRRQMGVSISAPGTDIMRATVTAESDYTHIDSWLIRTSFGASCRLYDTLKDKAHPLQAAEDALFDNVREYVYGEFRQPLLKLRSKMYEKGCVEEGHLVGQIIDSMFKE